MERYYKSRRRCNISTKRLSFLQYLFLGFVIVFLLSNILLFYISKRLDVILKQYIDVEVERLTKNIVNRAVSEKMLSKNYGKLYTYELGNNISYDTVKINILKKDITDYVQDVLLDLDNGKIEKYFVSKRIYSGRFKNIKKGVVCDVSVGSIRGSTLFANVGPTIPIKLVFNGEISSDVDIQAKEYGINNIMIEVYLVIEVKEQIIMPLTSKRKTIKIRIPISVDIVKGSIPEYYQKVFS